LFCADTVKKIKAYHPHIPILVVSPHVENARVQMALAAGANGYLPMGIDIDELVRVLYTVNRGELTLHPSLLPAILQQLEAEPGGKSAVSNPDDLTQRESAILSALSRGLTDREIASSCLSASVRCNLTWPTSMKSSTFTAGSRQPCLPCNISLNKFP
jgi:DNA-binding NarL/FixJ family response regulator